MVTLEESQRLLPWPSASVSLVHGWDSHLLILQAQGGSGRSTWPGTLMVLLTGGPQHPGETGSLPLTLTPLGSDPQALAGGCPVTETELGVG